MARDAVTIVGLAVDGGTAPGAGTTINVANGALLAAGGNTQRLAIHVKNTAVADKNVTIKAGANPPALAQGVGDLVVSVPASTGERLIVVESARFAQINGDIHVDFETGMTGTILAYRLPKV
jgi:hypothetical protein